MSTATASRSLADAREFAKGLVQTAAGAAQGNGNGHAARAESAAPVWEKNPNPKFFLTTGKSAEQISAEKSAILEKVAKGGYGGDVAKAMTDLKAIEAQEQGGRLYLQVGLKGGVSLGGLQRMPVTLYVDQWERLLSAAPAIADFLVAHGAECSTGKDDPRFAAK